MSVIQYVELSQNMIQSSIRPKQIYLKHFIRIFYSMTTVQVPGWNLVI